MSAENFLGVLGAAREKATGRGKEWNEETLVTLDKPDRAISCRAHVALLPRLLAAWSPC